MPCHLLSFLNVASSSTPPQHLLLNTQVDCDAPPADCTGVPAIDALLVKADVGCKIGLSKANTLYTWAGFCKAVKQFNSIAGTTRRLHLGDSTTAGAAQGLTNIAALLAQCMWESGGDAPFSACDENNFKHTDTAACTQREDGERYDTLTDQPWHCPVLKVSIVYNCIRLCKYNSLVLLLVKHLV